MDHAAFLAHGHGHTNTQAMVNFTKTLKKAIHNTFRYGQGTRDMAGPDGLTTEQFVDKVAWRLGRYVAAQLEEVAPKDLLIPSLKFRRNCKFNNTNNYIKIHARAHTYTFIYIHIYSR
jgi:hypothetical protein